MQLLATAMVGLIAFCLGLWLDSALVVLASGATYFVILRKLTKATVV